MKKLKRLCIGLVFLSSLSFSLSTFSTVQTDSLYCASLDDQGALKPEVYLLTYQKEFNDEMIANNDLKKQGINQVIDVVYFPNISDTKTFDLMIGLSFQEYSESDHLIKSSDSYNVIVIQADGTVTMKYFLMTWPIETANLNEAFLFDAKTQDLVASLTCQQFELIEEEEV